MIAIQGHRGARGVLPENSLPGFDYCVQIGADAIELDLQLTKEGDVVIYHDFMIDEMPVCKMPLALLKKIDIGTKNHPRFPKQKKIPNTYIPTLEELLSHIPPGTIPLNLEIKRDSKQREFATDPHLLAKKIIDLVRHYGYEKCVYYSSFDEEVLQAVRKIVPEATIGLIFYENIEERTRIGKQLRVNILSPFHSLMSSKEQVNELQKEGFSLIPWTVNEKERFIELCGYQVNGIISDYPGEMMTTRNQIEKERSLE